MTSWTPRDAHTVALAFVAALARRDYGAAFATTALDYHGEVDLHGLRSAFEAIVPPDHGVLGPIEVVETLDDWPARQPRDVAWVYVSLGSAASAQGLAVVVTAEEGMLRIRKIEWGRP